MKVKSITIIIESTEESEKESKHATVLEFKDGMWTTNGAVYSRYNEMMHQLWKMVKFTPEGRNYEGK